MFVYEKWIIHTHVCSLQKKKEERIKSYVASYLLKKSSRNLHTFRICKIYKIKASSNNMMTLGWLFDMRQLQNFPYFFDDE